MMLSEKEIAYQIKPITRSMVDADYSLLCTKASDLRDGKQGVVTDRSRIGNDVVDFFTFEERLRTRSKYNIHFYDFVRRIDEFKEKKFVRNMLTYYKEVKNKNNTKNEFVVMKEVFNICIGAINIFRPLVAMEIYAKYRPTCVLDICAGWGGRCVGAAAMGVPNYIGLDINKGLMEGYANLVPYLQEKSVTKVDMRFCDATQTDYGALPSYDMVFTSPPYYFLEKYSHNSEYANKPAMNREFYEPVFTQAYKHLVPGGRFVLNVNREIYESVCVPLLGEAHDILPFKKSKRQNEYSESIYVWKKKSV